jgi:hypothetical protein
LREWGARLTRWRVPWLWYAVALCVPLAVHVAAVGLTVAAGGTAGPLTFNSVTTFLLVFYVRLVNPTDGPLGEEPGVARVRCPGPARALLAAAEHHNPGLPSHRLAPFHSSSSRTAACSRRSWSAVW